jgi:hypothetical protein
MENPAQFWVEINSHITRLGGEVSPLKEFALTAPCPSKKPS